MKSRLLVAAFGVPLLLIVLLVLPAFATALLCALLAAIAAHEMANAAGAGARSVRYSVISAALIPLVIFWISDLFEALVCVLLLLLFCDLVVSRGKSNELRFSDICTALFAGVLLPVMFSCLMLLRADAEYGRVFVFMPLVAAFCSDSLAFFAGCALGKHKLAPSVSPNKTVEGAIGGLAGGVIGMLIMGLILKFPIGYDISLPMMALFGLIGSFLGQLGDLSFSAVKREYDIKDYGKLLPGHGGVLDRFDSVLFVAPVFWILLRFFEI